ncbi:DUF1254 domain-containing protein [Cupriavidus sp. BIS7]|uniref:DUF1254 domain-containing protein n=1 Tax=Cupriavidus sp. BIS7 TaxID=1217718 RepID=UPI0002D60D2E|nr:DUF1254 domain-containing protein [Cupriavidus sp. BIS7]
MARMRLSRLTFPRTLISATAVAVALSASIPVAIAADHAAPAAAPAAKLPPGPVAGTNLPKSYVLNVGKMAYIWGWPMVNMRNRYMVFSKVPENGLGDGVLPVAPLNRLTMLTDYIKPEERAVATPNQDVVYGFGLLSLEKEPVVFQVPDFGNRFWVYQLGDQRTDTLGGAGRMYGTKPGFYMVVGPNWKGKTPKGIQGVYRSPTNIAYIIPRAFLDDTAQDRQAIQPVISQVMAYPLSEYDGKVKTRDWSKIPSLSDPAGGKQGSGGETQWVKPEAFFKELPIILKEVPPQRGEEALYAWFQSILDAAAKDPAIADTLTQAALDADKEMMTPMHQYSYAGVPVGNGWVASMNGAEFGTDYYSRAAAAKANIFVNPRREAAYFGQEYDSNKARLNGASAYTLTFPKGALPPVNGFWSLTLYDAAHFFAPNEINRYSLGTKNKDLVYNADGSLTLYVQNKKPAADKLANWLPAPTGDFELFVRAYWPKAEILQNTWAPPPVIKAN